ncbi:MULTISPECIES: glycerol kinase GlpK [Marinobacter]|jgi:glycerol kinase|uniref:Glycerol kinase n=2 Tax=Marinobacter TaxID=2742 RepID=A0A137SB62_9GAMM|nr:MULTISPECIES: glycerol kinase GlpK [Marinobacter]WBU42216.1 glycerol kinase GlpK [Marinobacter alkaliphilus]KXO09677.1 Glycerol kinase [Marinobacter excellens LAMA 842]MAO14619.1 glycerol kinase [Marinobacter sp.]MCD1629772.1 glycerol kinase GlpK [Marinobacter shengliensis]PSF15116.1 glycerol kinase [Marinobacter shengliensis]
MSRYLLAIDQGTTSSRAIVFDARGTQVAVAQQEFHQYFPRDGWVEHDAVEIWDSTLAVCREALEKAGVQASDLAGIGITNQRETTVVWDRETGEPIHHAIVWQDRRTASLCTKLKSDGHEALVVERTGLLIDPYFSATKVAWLLDNVEGARKRAEAGELAFGTVDTWLLWNLTNGQSHYTDATNASRTALFNIHNQDWDDDLLALFRVPKALLPEVLDCADEYGDTHADWLGAPVKVAGIAGDQHAALIGQACFEPGMAKSTYGTGCFLMLNTGDQALRSENRLLTTMAYRLNGKPCYAIEGSIFVAGAAMQWLRDGLRLITHASESAGHAETVGVDNPVYLVPAFTGLGAPHWDPNARGAILGLTRDTGIAEIVTAGLQSVCYQTKDLVRAIRNDGARLESIRVDGGMAVNDWVMQFLCDILNVTVDRPKVTETTALGAAYLAGLQTGVFESLEQISDMWECERQFRPDMKPALRESLYAGWLDAVERVCNN